MEKWKNGDRVEYKCGDDWYSGTIIGWDETGPHYVIHFDDFPHAAFGRNLGVGNDPYLRPAPRTIENIVQEGVEDFASAYCGSMMYDFTGADTLDSESGDASSADNILAAIIEAACNAAVEADRAKR